MCRSLFFIMPICAGLGTYFHNLCPVFKSNPRSLRRQHNLLKPSVDLHLNRHTSPEEYRFAATHTSPPAIACATCQRMDSLLTAV